MHLKSGCGGALVLGICLSFAGKASSNRSVCKLRDVSFLWLHSRGSLGRAAVSVLCFQAEGLGLITWHLVLAWFDNVPLCGGEITSERIPEVSGWQKYLVW